MIDGKQSRSGRGAAARMSSVTSFIQYLYNGAGRRTAEGRVRCINWIDDTWSGILLYADDIVMMAEDGEQLQRMLDVAGDNGNLSLIVENVK